MYVDHMHPRTLMTVENFTQHWKGKTLPELKSGGFLAADLRKKTP
jgi:hypothetical protein